MVCYYLLHKYYLNTTNSNNITIGRKKNSWEQFLLLNLKSHFLLCNKLCIAIYKYNMIAYANISNVAYIANTRCFYQGKKVLVRWYTNSIFNVCQSKEWKPFYPIAMKWKSTKHKIFSNMIYCYFVSDVYIFQTNQDLIRPLMILIQISYCKQLFI